MLASTSKGIALQLKDDQLMLDGRGEMVFVSHAHSDHSMGTKKSKRIISSNETIDLMHARNYADSMQTKNKLVFDTSFDYTLLDAGHVLGSKMIHIKGDHSFTYTGDFKLKPSLTNKGAEIVNADLLLMETTYGAPFYQFPPAQTVYEEMSRWVENELAAGSSIIIGGYALGKAQEIIKLLNEYCGITPVVNTEIHRISQVYNKYGVPLNMVSENSSEGKELLSRQFVAVVAHHTASFAFAKRLSEFYGTQISCAVVTGWAMNGNFPVDRAFCLSDHCDFKDSLEFVEAISPKRVITTHGFEKEFARELNKRGINAEPLAKFKKAKAQKMLLEY